MLMWPVRFLAQRLFLSFCNLIAQTAAPLQFLRWNSSGHNDGRPIEYYRCNS